MRDNRQKTGAAACWLVPAVLAAPFVVVLAMLMARYGDMLKEAAEVAAKLVVIP